MSKNSGTLHSAMLDSTPGALEMRTFSQSASEACAISSDGGSSSIDGWLLKQLRRSVGILPIRLVLGRHEEISFPAGTEAIATVSVADRRTLARLLFSPEIAFGDAYTDGRIVVDGDLAQLMEGSFLQS